MKDFLRIGDKLALLELWHCCWTIDKMKVDGAYHVSLLKAYIEISITADL